MRHAGGDGCHGCGGDAGGASLLRSVLPQACGLSTFNGHVFGKWKRVWVLMYADPRVSCTKVPSALCSAATLLQHAAFAPSVQIDTIAAGRAE